MTKNGQKWLAAYRGAADMLIYGILLYFTFAQSVSPEYDRRIAQIATIVIVLVILSSYIASLMAARKGSRKRMLMAFAPMILAMIHSVVFLVDVLLGGQIGALINIPGHQWSAVLRMHVMLSLYIERRAILRNRNGLPVVE